MEFTDVQSGRLKNSILKERRNKLNKSQNDFFNRIEEKRDEDKPLENTLSQLENILEDWEIAFDDIDSKYIVKNCHNFNLNQEQLGWIYSMGLLIFDIHRYDEVVKITLYQKRVDGF